MIENCHQAFQECKYEMCFQNTFINKYFVHSATWYALAKQGRFLHAYKVARYAYEKLQMLKLPLRFQDAIDVATVTIRSKPFHDNEVLLLQTTFFKLFFYLFFMTGTSACVLALSNYKSYYK